MLPPKAGRICTIPISLTSNRCNLPVKPVETHRYREPSPSHRSRQEHYPGFTRSMALAMALGKAQSALLPVRVVIGQAMVYPVLHNLSGRPDRFRSPPPRSKAAELVSELSTFTHQLKGDVR